MNMLEYCYLKTGNDLLEKISLFWSISWFNFPRKIKLIVEILKLKREYNILKKKYESQI